MEEKKKKKKWYFQLCSLKLVFFLFDCQRLEQCELHLVPEKAVLSGLECDGGNHAGVAVCFIHSCVPEITSHLIKCLSSSHWLHTWNKLEVILPWHWARVRIGLREPLLLYPIVVVWSTEDLLWDLDPSFGTSLIWGGGRGGQDLAGLSLSFLQCVKCMCSRPNPEQRRDSLLASVTSWANSVFVDFSVKLVLLPKLGKREERQEWEIQVWRLGMGLVPPNLPGKYNLHDTGGSD